MRRYTSDLRRSSVNLTGPDSLARRQRSSQRFQLHGMGLCLCSSRHSIPHLFPQHFAFLEKSFSQSSASSACPLAQRSLLENQSMCSAGSWLSSIHPAGQTEAVCVNPRKQLVLDCSVEDWKRNLLK